MNELKIFTKEIMTVLFEDVRMQHEFGADYYCAADVCKALGYVNPRAAIKRHCKGSMKRRVLTNGGYQNLTFLGEGDVFRLIAHSKLPAAQRLESWLFDEVLPSIRKHGGYMMDSTIQRLKEDPGYVFELSEELLKSRNERFMDQRNEVIECQL